MATFLFGAGAASAEPYIAVQNGLSCSACHVNRTGGGQRNTFGSGIGRTSLPARRVEGLWEGVIAERLRLGADLRVAYVGNIREDEPYIGEYELAAANLYLSAELIPDRLLLYLDESLEGTATSREAFALLSSSRAGMYVKAGKFFPPFGLRLQDDEATTRRATGFTFESSDVGVEFGAEPGDWNLALAVTNGTAGATEADNGKQITARGALVRRHWRLGASVSHNDLPAGSSRSVGGFFGGVEIGPVVVLAEWDRIEDRLPEETDAGSDAAHVEFDWTPQRGWTVRGWIGRWVPDERPTDSEEPGTQDQYGLGLDWTPLPGLQVRAYYRLRDGSGQVPGSEDDEAVVEMHLFF